MANDFSNIALAAITGGGFGFFFGWLGRSFAHIRHEIKLKDTLEIAASLRWQNTEIQAENKILLDALAKKGIQVSEASGG